MDDHAFAPPTATEFVVAAVAVCVVAIVAFCVVAMVTFCVVVAGAAVVFVETGLVCDVAGLNEKKNTPYFASILNRY